MHTQVYCLTLSLLCKLHKIWFFFKQNYVRSCWCCICCSSTATVIRRKREEEVITGIVAECLKNQTAEEASRKKSSDKLPHQSTEKSFTWPEITPRHTPQIPHNKQTDHLFLLPSFPLFLHLCANSTLLLLLFSSPSSTSHPLLLFSSSSSSSISSSSSFSRLFSHRESSSPGE